MLLTNSCKSWRWSAIRHGSHGPWNTRVSKTATNRFESLIPQDWGFAAFVAVLVLSPLWYGSVLVSAQLGNCAALACIAGWLAISARREGVIGNPPPALLAAAVLFRFCDSMGAHPIVVARAASVAASTMEYGR